MTRPTRKAAGGPPGTNLLAFARWWFDERTMAGVFEPLVADWQRQWRDATPARRRWINVKGRAAFAATTVLLMPRATFASSSFRARPLLLAGTFWLVTSCLLTIPFIRESWTSQLIWLLLPSTLTVMLPFAILPAIDAMRRDGKTPTPSDRQAALALVTVAVIGVVIGHGWIAPAANQQWRNAFSSELNGRPTVVRPGLREMTTSQLFASPRSSIPRLSGDTARVRELNMRVPLASLPAVLAWLRWLSLSRPRKRSWPITNSCFLAIATTGAFFAVMPVSAALEPALAPGFGPVLALALFALTTRTGMWLRQRAV